MPARQRGRPDPRHGALITRGSWLAALAAASRAPCCLGAGRPRPATPRPAPPRLAEELTVTAAREQTRIADTPASVAILPRAALDATASPFSTTRCARWWASRSSAGPAAAPPTRPPRACRCAAWGRAARAARWCSPTASRSTTRSAAGSTGRASRAWASSGSRCCAAARPTSTAAAPWAVSSSSCRAPRARAAASRPSSRPAGRRPSRATLTRARGAAASWAGRLSAEGYTTDGYVPVEEASRGAVDSEAASRHLALDARVERRSFGDGRVFLRGAGLRRGPRQRHAAADERHAHRARRARPRLGQPRARADVAARVGPRPSSSTRPSARWPPTARART